MNLLRRIKQATIVGSLAAVFIGGASSAAAAPAHPNVVPAVGGSNTRFTFVVGGFQGDPDDGDEDTVNDAEKVSFWINMPDGQSFRAVRDGASKDADDKGFAQANRAGEAELTWRAPENLPAGSYTLVAHGNQSGYETVVPFRLEGGSRGILMSESATVTPNNGSAGTSFSFVIGGFQGDPDDGDEDTTNDAEKVAFWINTPDGQAIRATRTGLKPEDKDADKATVDQAYRDGTVVWTWQAPADAAPGIYTLVAHGLQSEREQVIAIEIR
jgi:hypothetical protein